MWKDQIKKKNSSGQEKKNDLKTAIVVQINPWF